MPKPRPHGMDQTSPVPVGEILSRIGRETRRSRTIGRVDRGSHRRARERFMPTGGEWLLILLIVAGAVIGFTATVMILT